MRMPELCSARMQMVEYRSGEPIFGAHVRIQQAARDGHLPSPTVIALDTDVNGHAIVAELARGQWDVDVELDGYETRTFEVGLTAPPGEEQDWGQATLSKLQPLPVRLVGAPPAETFEGYTVELNFAEEAVPFDRSGLAVLQMGWYELPIEIIVKYPDGQHKYSSLHDIEPGSGEEAEVRVDGKRLLDVQLRYSEKAREIVADSKCWLRVASQGEGSNTFSSGRAVFAEGSYVFPDITVSEVEVSFATTFREWPVEWASTRATLEEDATTTVTLDVDLAPREVQLQSAPGVPMPDFSFRLRRERDQTGYTVGNLTDKDGRIEMMPELASGFVMSGSDMDGLTFAIDAPFSFDFEAEETPVALLGEFTDFFVDVVVDGEPTEGVEFAFHGRVNDGFFLSRTTNGLGRTTDSRFLLASQIRVYLSSDEYWWDLESLELLPGRNAVSLSRRGKVTSVSRDVLGNFLSEQRGASVADWVHSAKVQYTDEGGGRWGCLIPIGRYTLSSTADEASEFVVSAGETLRL